MKRDQYIPHDVSMRTTSEVICMIDKEGAAGYGFFWALMEYLRAQNGYEGNIRAIRSIARQMKIRMDKALRVLNDYRLFVVDGEAFRCPLLDERMLEIDRKRAACEAYKRRKAAENVSEAACNPLSANGGADIISLIQPQEQPVEQPQPPSTTKKEPAGDAAWEQYVDELRNEQQWQEIMAMRSGLGPVFVNRFGEVLQHFKRHVQAVGNEKNIRSLSDAKHYFNNFNTPGSVPFIRMMEELRKPIDKGKYRYEDRDPATGRRSYCGIPIPDDAPPRPNAQAAWSDGKWIY